MTPARVDLGKIWANATRFLVAQAALRISGVIESAMRIEANARIGCSSLIDWPVYPRLRRTMLTTTPKCNPASKSLYLLAAPNTPTRTRQRARKWSVGGLGRVGG
jgi:hypothetical protein